MTAPDGAESPVLVPPIAWTADASERRTPGSERAITTAALTAPWSIERTTRLGDSSPSVGGSSTISSTGSSGSDGGGGRGEGGRGGAVASSTLLPRLLLEDICHSNKLTSKQLEQ